MELAASEMRAIPFTQMNIADLSAAVDFVRRRQIELLRSGECGTVSAYSTRHLNLVKNPVSGS